ncbi:biotin/lipoyl-containing protein [Clostridium grantii]|uniref:Biotin-requiring enzyme n=1 Tax=Clostridium grantii DSM 8605 TaxID=1121316 RepID=A0A1M5T7H3_9CLOT|nr:biotin/lipoyl-containing protein [Clostridium grantii]SHH46666.1 Biotin-requiring enzyme [Clostridium grantii DSM 8605]
MKKYKVKLNGKVYEVEVEEMEVTSEPATFNGDEDKQKEKEKQSEVAATNSVEGEEILAPLPGNILEVKVKEGDSVKKGQILFILEAMKLENEIVASNDGIVGRILVNKGGTVVTGECLGVLKRN